MPVLLTAPALTRKYLLQSASDVFIFGVSFLREAGILEIGYILRLAYNWGNSNYIRLVREKVTDIMATVKITKDTLQDTIANNDIVIIDFWAPWCGPCKSFAPTYEKVSEEFDEVVFAKVNTEDEQELAASFQIRSIPTLMIFREQIAIFSQAGMLPESALKEVINKTKELDMAQVRKEVELQQAQAQTQQ